MEVQWLTFHIRKKSVAMTATEGKKERMRVSRGAEVLLINMSWRAQTSGGSCSVCLSASLCFRADTAMLEYHLFPTKTGWRVFASPKAKSQAEGEYGSCFCFSNYFPFDCKYDITLREEKWIWQIFQALIEKSLILYPLNRRCLLSLRLHFLP